jgi:hypothetical protein
METVMHPLKTMILPAVMLIATACEHGPSSLTKPGLSLRKGSASGSLSAATPRSGALHVTKNCATYAGNSGDFCTITSSNLADIEVGSRVIYASPVADGKIDSDLILDLPGPGNNRAFGHVTLDFSRQRGQVTFAGGTGRFTHFQASVDVTPLTADLVNWNWDGPYSFRP